MYHIDLGDHVTCNTASCPGRWWESDQCQTGHGHLDSTDELSCRHGNSGQWTGQSSTEAVPTEPHRAGPNEVHLSFWVSDHDLCLSKLKIHV